MKTKLPKTIKIVPQGPKCLFLTSGRSECTITNESGAPVSIEEAKAQWEAGTVEDFNLSLRRLALLNWDYEALKKYYSQGGRL